ncbi:MAG TPA: amidohydrolase family protein [Chryseosolibacter sp.]|nr:amidohydrolase family protein [Chryseosolibacter sp.]
MTEINRRKFMKDTALSVAGVMLGSQLMKCSPRDASATEDAVASFDLMKEVMSYRKIDAHAHVYFSDDSPATQLDLADRLGIEKLVISRPMVPGSKGLPEEFIRCNNLVLKAAKQHPDRLIGQPTLNPQYQKESLEEIKRCIGEGMVGLKVYNHVKINDPLFYPIIERYIDMKMIILMHVGIGKSRIAYDAGEPPNVSIPEDFADVAKRYPEAMFQFAHLAGGEDWEDACNTLKNSPNVFLDVSGSNNDAGIVDYAVKSVGVDRILFGCDNSFYQGVGHVIAANLDTDQRKKIFFDNYNNILKKSGRHVS